MGRVETDWPTSGGGIFDMPLWLLIPLALVWVYFVMREPKNGGPNYGWYVPPAVITIAAFVLVAGISRA